MSVSFKSPFFIGQRVFDGSGHFAGIVLKVEFSPPNREYVVTLDSAAHYTDTDMEQDIGRVGQREQGLQALPDVGDPYEFYEGLFSDAVRTAAEQAAEAERKEIEEAYRNAGYPWDY